MMIVWPLGVVWQCGTQTDRWWQVCRKRFLHSRPLALRVVAMAAVEEDPLWEYDAPRIYDFRRDDEGASQASRWFNDHGHSGK